MLVSFQGRKRRGLQPLSRDDQALFQAVLRGEHAGGRGFRSGEVAERLYGSRPKDEVERRQAVRADESPDQPAACPRLGCEISALEALPRAAALRRSAIHEHGN